MVWKMGALVKSWGNWRKKEVKTFVDVSWSNVGQNSCYSRIQLQPVDLTFGCMIADHTVCGWCLLRPMQCIVRVWEHYPWPFGQKSGWFLVSTAQICRQCLGSVYSYSACMWINRDSAFQLLPARFTTKYSVIWCENGCLVFTLLSHTHQIFTFAGPFCRDISI